VVADASVEVDRRVEARCQVDGWVAPTERILDGGGLSGRVGRPRARVALEGAPDGWRLSWSAGSAAAIWSASNSAASTAASVRWKWLGSSWRPRPHTIFLRRCDGDALDWRQTLSGHSVSPQIRWTREQRAHGREDSEPGLFRTQCAFCERWFWLRGRRFNHGFGRWTAARPWRATHLAMARAGDVIIRALRTGPWHVLALHHRCFVRFERYRHRGPACPEPLPSATSRA
jgi:hypothetical protein